jgi:hypothetical protein
MSVRTMAKGRTVMTMGVAQVAEQGELRPLTKGEIDRRIVELLERIEAGAEEGLSPRWIRAADLVRDLAPYLSRN